MYAAADELNQTHALVFAATLSKDYVNRELLLYAGAQERVYPSERRQQLLADIDQVTDF